MENITVKHSGISIEYVESSDKWRYEFDGRERHADSLKNAKAAIDAGPKRLKKPFVPIPAFKRETWGESFEPVAITSFVDEDGMFSRPHHAWITDSKGKRHKENLRMLVADTPANQQLIDEWKEINRASKKLRDKLEKINSQIKSVEVPPDTEEQSK